MPLSEFFLCSIGPFCPLASSRDFSFGKRAGSRPNFSWRRRAPFASARQQGLTHDPHHLLIDLAAFGFISGLSEARQESSDRVTGQRETELSGGQVQRFCRLI